MIQSRRDIEKFRRSAVLVQRGSFSLSYLDIPASPQVESPKTVVFLHGAAGNLTQWWPQLAHFYGKVRIIALDQRGHGQSAFPARSHFVIDEFVQDLRCLADLLEAPESFDLVGHSFGGAIAAAFAVLYPEKVTSLALVGTAGKIHIRPSLAVLLKLPEFLLNPIQKGFHNSVSAPPEVLKKLIPYVISWRGWELYPQVRCRAVGIAGEWDLLTRPSAMAEMMRQIPGGAVEHVSFAGHLPQLDRSRRVNEILEAFIFPEQKKNWRGIPKSL